MYIILGTNNMAAMDLLYCINTFSLIEKKSPEIRELSDLNKCLNFDLLINEFMIHE